MKQDSTSPQGDLSDTLRALGLLLRSERVKHDNMSREELAATAGVSVRMVGKVERGDTEALVEAWRMAVALGQEFAELVAEAERRAG